MLVDTQMLVDMFIGTNFLHDRKNAACDRNVNIILEETTARVEIASQNRKFKCKWQKLT